MITTAENGHLKNICKTNMQNNLNEDFMLPKIYYIVIDQRIYSHNYGIRYVPIKMNVIFQETYENIN